MTFFFIFHKKAEKRHINPRVNVVQTSLSRAAGKRSGENPPARLAGNLNSITENPEIPPASG
ncbi:hypothetical protein [Sinomicrobium soli]|uniref:hypothetical protein n=1 Tax=Sinomicrobium sp. N-1-3-6 TaxID=2219864 RepID=UPI000DCC7D7F|nr:hypothetical protein [Sinomicrobium sp. N-1-3-6]RAV29877.1 hypothetical protein DN748_07195 [Sinomicrobium sp. N-1-3-6]